MGTLTAHQERLPQYCEHKLPTSCRLTSIPNCCACADERPHAPSYAVYIDGVGYVPRGTRWQRYCWYCKEFWTNRVHASGMSSTQTSIPVRPDQAEFLQRWYEFHQGYRILQQQDGQEVRVDVRGEDFMNVPPGHLPRTLEQIQAGVERESVQMQLSNRDRSSLSTGVTQPSLDQLFDQLIEEAETPESLATVNVSASSAGHTTVDAGRLIAPDHSIPAHASREMSGANAQAAVASTSQTPGLIADRIVLAREQLAQAQITHDEIASRLTSSERELTIVRRRLQRLQNEQRTMQNYTTVFGTREEMAAQGDDYQSPVGALFGNAYDRFRVAEATRREQVVLREILEQENLLERDQVESRLAELEALESDPWRRTQSRSSPAILSPDSEESALQAFYQSIRRHEREGDTPMDSELRQTQPPPDGNDAILNAMDIPQEIITPGDLASTADLAGEARQMITWLDQNSSTYPEVRTELLTLLSEEPLPDAAREGIENIINTSFVSFAAKIVLKRILDRRRNGCLVTFDYTFPIDETSLSSHPLSMMDLELMGEMICVSQTFRDIAQNLMLTGTGNVQRMYLRVQNATRAREVSDYEHLRSLCLNSQIRSHATRMHVGYTRAMSAQNRLQLQQFSARQYEFLSDLSSPRPPLNDQAVPTSTSDTRFERLAFVRRDMDTTSLLQRQRRTLLANFPARPLYPESTRIASPGPTMTQTLDPAPGASTTLPDRPDPKTDEQMTIRQECRICFTQIADIVTLPCGHLIMCMWCSEQHCPGMANDHTQPRYPASCAMCRKPIKKKVRVYRA